MAFADSINRGWKLKIRTFKCTWAYLKGPLTTHPQMVRIQGLHFEKQNTIKSTHIDMINKNKYENKSSFWSCTFSKSRTIEINSRKSKYVIVVNRKICWLNAYERKSEHYKYSLLMHCIKIKSPAKFLLNEQYVLVGGNIYFLCVLSCISEEA